MRRAPNDGVPTDDGADHRAAWLPFVVRIVVALIVATPFVAIVLQALGKR